MNAVRNRVAACDQMDVDVIVAANRAYLTYVEAEAVKRHAAGMDAREAAQDIALEGVGALGDPERIAVTVDTLFREINDDKSSRDVADLYGKMAELDRRFRAQGIGKPSPAPSTPTCNHHH